MQTRGHGADGAGDQGDPRSIHGPGHHGEREGGRAQQDGGPHQRCNHSLMFFYSGLLGISSNAFHQILNFVFQPLSLKQRRTRKRDRRWI